MKNIAIDRLTETEAVVYPRLFPRGDKLLAVEDKRFTATEELRDAVEFLRLQFASVVRVVGGIGSVNVAYRRTEGTNLTLDTR